MSRLSAQQWSMLDEAARSTIQAVTFADGAGEWRTVNSLIRSGLLSPRGVITDAGRARHALGLAPASASATPSLAMSTRKPNPIQAVSTAAGFRLTRPGARYAVHREGDARPGSWLPDDEALPSGWADVYPEDEARSLLPFLRVRGTAGRRGAEPTTADGKLVARVCKRLGLTAAALGERIGAHEAVLSRARHGELPAHHRDAIKALLKGKGKGAS